MVPVKLRTHPSPGVGDADSRPQDRPTSRFPVEPVSDTHPPRDRLVRPSVWLERPCPDFWALVGMLGRVLLWGGHSLSGRRLPFFWPQMRLEAGLWLGWWVTAGETGNGLVGRSVWREWPCPGSGVLRLMSIPLGWRVGDEAGIRLLVGFLERKFVVKEQPMVEDVSVGGSGLGGVGKGPGAGFSSGCRSFPSKDQMRRHVVKPTRKAAFEMEARLVGLARVLVEALVEAGDLTRSALSEAQLRGWAKVFRLMLGRDGVSKDDLAMVVAYVVFKARERAPYRHNVSSPWLFRMKASVVLIKALGDREFRLRVVASLDSEYSLVMRSPTPDEVEMISLEIEGIHRPSSSFSSDDVARNEDELYRGLVSVTSLREVHDAFYRDWLPKAVGLVYGRDRVPSRRARLEVGKALVRLMREIRDCQNANFRRGEGRGVDSLGIAKVGSPGVLVEGYIKWLQEQTWLTNIGISAFRFDRALFSKNFISHWVRMHGLRIHPLTGEPLS